MDPKTQEQWTNSGERREKAVEMILAGEMQGYLAYKEDKAIGWCNANDRENYRYLYERNGFTEVADLKYVKVMQKRL